MSDRSYVASYQPTAFLKGYWVDDMAAVEFQITDPKEPLYGFRDQEFRGIAKGQTLVHGMLDINFRIKGYLALVLAKLATLDERIARNMDGTKTDAFKGYGISTQRRRGGATDTPDSPQRLSDILHAAHNGNDFASAGIDPLSLTSDARRAFLEKSYQDFDIENFFKLSSAVREDLWDGGVDPYAFGVVEANRPRPGVWPLPFDLTVVYDQIPPGNLSSNLDNARVEVIRDVHIVGMSKMITNAVPGGARPVIERYQFIARTVE